MGIGITKGKYSNPTRNLLWSKTGGTIICFRV